MCAPLDGQVLQIKMHLGEFALNSMQIVGQPAIILLGCIQPLHVRVDVNENDAWKIIANESAIGFLRVNKNIMMPLKFEELNSKFSLRNF